MRLSDSIETFIKALMTEEEPAVELKRNELAEYFGCAPSQINYVLATRFTVDNGYLIESRRGGGGYIRIVRVVQTLVEQQLITPGEGSIMRAAICSQALAVPMPDTLKNALRARMMKTMLMTVAQQNRTLNV